MSAPLSMQNGKYDYNSYEWYFRRIFLRKKFLYAYKFTVKGK